MIYDFLTSDPWLRNLNSKSSVGVSFNFAHETKIKIKIFVKNSVNYL